MKNWYKTNINFDGALSDRGKAEIARLKEEANAEGAGYDKFLLSDAPVLSEDWVNQMSKKGLTPTSVLMFYRPANFNYPLAHIDGGRERRIYMGLNWIEDEDDNTDMVWYNPVPLPPMDENDRDMVYYEFDPKELTECDRATVGFGKYMSLVRADIPHNIYVRDKPRLCVSVRFWIDFNSWEDAVDHFKDFIVE